MLYMLVYCSRRDTERHWRDNYSGRRWNNINEAHKQMKCDCSPSYLKIYDFMVVEHGTDLSTIPLPPIENVS